MLDDRNSSYEISPLDRIKYEYPFFIIEIEGEPRNPQLMGTVSLASALHWAFCPHYFQGVSSLWRQLEKTTPIQVLFLKPVLMDYWDCSLVFIDVCRQPTISYTG